MNKFCVSLVRLLVVAIALLSSQLLTSCSKNEEQTAPSIKPTIAGGRLYFPTSDLYIATKNELAKMSDKQRINWSQSYKFQTWYPKQFRGPQFYNALLNDKGEVQVENVIIKIKDGYVYNIPTSKAKLLSDIDAGSNSSETDNYKKVFGTPIPIEVLSSNGSETQSNARWSNKREVALTQLIPGLYKQYYQMRWAMVLYEYEDSCDFCIGRPSSSVLQLELWLQATDTRYSNNNYFQAGDNCNLEINNTRYTYRPWNSTQGIFNTEANVTSNQGGWLPRPLSNIAPYPTNGGSGSFGVGIRLSSDFKAFCPAISNSNWTGTFVVSTY